MTTTQNLREYLDAHGVDGAPTEPGLYVVEAGSLPARIVEVEVTGGGVWWGRADMRNAGIVRHAPLALAPHASPK